MRQKIKTRKFSLVTHIDARVARDYSLFKLGDPDIINAYAIKLALLIKKHLPTKRASAIYTTNKYPTNVHCKKNSLLMAEIIAERLGKPLIIAEYRYTSDSRKFYDDQVSRKTMTEPTLRNKKLLKSHSYHVVMVDDSTFSGLTFRTSLINLREITDSVDLFSIINLRGSAYSEKAINNFVFEKRGVPVLAQVLKKPGYVFTSHFLRTFDKLTREQRLLLYKKITPQQKRLLRKAFALYFKREIT